MAEIQQPQKNPALIYDVGMHIGQDTDYYLKKGFNVVAFEAEPGLAEKGRIRFANEISMSRLVIVEGAIVDKSYISAGKQTVQFFRNKDQSVWGTVASEWAERNENAGTTSEIIEVPVVDFTACLVQYGIPYYLKIDIEGMDKVCLKTLMDFKEKPDYISIESEKVTFSDLEEEFALFQQLGYTMFQAVNQAAIEYQKEPADSTEGKHTGYHFQAGASGLFGKDLRGRWFSYPEIMQQYQRIFKWYALIGDSSKLARFFPVKVFLYALNKLTRKPIPGWYDTHARHNSVK